MYCLTKIGGEVVKVATRFLFPNGLAVQHTDDGRPKLLIVAETPAKTLWAFDIVGPGKVENRRIWGKLPGKSLLEISVPFVRTGHNMWVSNTLW